MKEHEVLHKVHEARAESYFSVPLRQEKAGQLSRKKNSDWCRMEVIPESQIQLEARDVIRFL